MPCLSGSASCLVPAWNAVGQVAARHFSVSASAADVGPTLVTRLASRAVLLMQGEDAFDFLQGMVTNDVTLLQQPGATPLYAAMLTAKGKYLHDVFIYRIPQGSTTRGSAALWLEVDADGRGHVLQWLSRYKLRRRVQLEDVSTENAAWAAWRPAGAAPAVPAGGGWHHDPRGLPALGLRGIFAAGSLPEELAGGTQASEDSYRQVRYSLGVPEGDAEIPTERAAPLEYNMDVLRGVSYTKGCYIGQERNSYTHFRGIIRRRVMPVAFGDNASGTPAPSPELGTEVFVEGQPAKSVGTIAGSCGAVGLAHLRLSAALAATSGRGPLLVAGGVGVWPQRPSWWPSSWGHEEDTPTGGPPIDGANT